MKTLYIAAIEPITDELDLALGGEFRIRLSDGSYLAGAVHAVPVEGTANSLPTLRIEFEPEGIDLPEGYGTVAG